MGYHPPQLQGEYRGAGAMYRSTYVQRPAVLRASAIVFVVTDKQKRPVTVVTGMRVFAGPRPVL